jgi:hypothetical protein
LALVIACFVVVVFIAAFHALKIVTVARQALMTAHEGMTAMRDPALDDEAREKAARQAATRLFGGFLSITLRSLIAVLASVTVIYVADLIGLVPAPVAIARLESWDFIVAATAVVSAGYLVVGRMFRLASQR